MTDVVPAAVVLTKASRATTTLPRTLRDLADAGINPQTITSTYTGPLPDAEVRRQALNAIQLAAGDPLGMLFFEDDIAVDAPLFQHHLRLALSMSRIVAFCTVNPKHHPPGMLNDPSPILARLEALPAWDAPYGRDGGFHGSMAVYLPPAVVRFALDRPHEFQRDDGAALTVPVIAPDAQHHRITGFDLWLKHHAKSFGGIYGAFPNPVDHLGDGGHRWRALTYGAAWRYA